MLFQLGESCVLRRLSRRLEASAVRVDYVIVVPANPEVESKGGAEAIGKRAVSYIQEVSAQQATTWLVEALLEVPALRNFSDSAGRPRAAQ